MKSFNFFVIFFASFLTSCTPVDYSKMSSYVYIPSQNWNPQGYETYFPNTSSINLKVIQTRKFSKSPIEVAKAIDISCKDRNALNNTTISLVLRGECTFPPEYKSKYYSKYAAFNFLNEATPLSVKYEYEITAGEDKKTSIVRIRAYFYAHGIKESDRSKQITNPKFYNDEFKLIADSLFVNAIEINPQEVK